MADTIFAPATAAGRSAIAVPPLGAGLRRCLLAS